MKMKLKTPKALIGAATVATAVTVGFAMPSLAQTGPRLADEVIPTQTAHVEAAIAADEVTEGEIEGEVAGDETACFALFDELETAFAADGEWVDGDLDEFEGDFELEEWEPSDAEIAEINAETDALAAFLTEKGFDATVETDDEYGITYVDIEALISEVSDEEIDDLFTEFYESHDLDSLVWADEVEVDFDPELEAEFEAAFEAELAELGFDIEDLEACEELTYEAGEGAHALDGDLEFCDYEAEDADEYEYEDEGQYEDED